MTAYSLCIRLEFFAGALWHLVSNVDLFFLLHASDAQLPRFQVGHGKLKNAPRVLLCHYSHSVQ